MKKLANVHLYALLAIANIAIFLVLWLGSGYSDPPNLMLVDWGANVPMLTLTGDSWRLLASAFLHANWLHLLANMYMLLLLGSLLERTVGSWRFAAVYLLSALAGSLASAYWHSFSETGALTVSVGASGALMGLAGAALALVMAHHEPWPAETQTQTRIKGSAIFQVIVINLVFGFTTRGVDNAAHIGGLVVGFIAGWVLFRGDPTANAYRRMGLPLLVTVVGAAVLTALSFHRTDDLVALRTAIFAERAEEAAEKLAEQKKAAEEQRKHDEREKVRQAAIKTQDAMDEKAKEEARTRPAPSSDGLAPGTTIAMGPEPIELVIGDSGKYAYTTDFVDNTLSVIDLARQTIVRTVHGPAFATGANAARQNFLDRRGALGVVVSPDERTAWVSSMQKSSVVRIDLTNDKVIDAAAAGPLPYDMLLSPAGDRLYVRNLAEDAKDDTITVLSVPQWPKVLATLKVPAVINGGISFERHIPMWLSEDGGRLFAMPRDMVRVFEFDTQDFHQAAVHPRDNLDGQPQGRSGEVLTFNMPASPSNGIWLAGDQQLGWIDPRTHKVAKRYDVCEDQPRMQAATRQTRLLASSRDGNLLAVEPPDSIYIRVYKMDIRRSIGAYSVRVDVRRARFSKDDKALYVLAAASSSAPRGTLTLLDLDKYAKPDVDPGANDFLCPIWPDAVARGQEAEGAQ